MEKPSEAGANPSLVGAPVEHTYGFFKLNLGFLYMAAGSWYLIPLKFSKINSQPAHTCGFKCNMPTARSRHEF